MKTLACKDAGSNCNFVARGNTEQEVLAQVTEHGKKAHGMKAKDFTPDKIRMFQKLIHEEPSHART